MTERTPKTLVVVWSKRGYDLDFDVGIALGYATCGEVGFEGRSDYTGFRRPVAAFDVVALRSPTAELSRP